MTVKLYDSAGRLLRSTVHNSVSHLLLPIDLSGFAAGIYYVNARLETGYEKTLKLIR